MVLSAWPGKIAVLGATGNTGKRLLRRLAQEGASVIAIARTLSRLQELAGGKVEVRSANAAGDPASLRDALKDAAIVVNVAHARYTRALIGALPDPATRLITLGSTRKFTNFPDQKAAEVIDAEAAYMEGVCGTILHPAMIYGGADNNISRIIRFVRLVPVVPLPLAGRALLQPIHIDDVVQCLVAVIRNDPGKEPLIIAGLAPLAYADVVRVCGRAAGRQVMVLPMPLLLMRILAWLSQLVPGLPHVSSDEVRRLLEDKAFDIAPMRARLGVTPCGFEEGLARMKQAGEIG